MPVKVSVVIPVHNAGKYIDPCIDSLLNQTLPAEDFEVLFVNDGSTDDTPARLEKLTVEHPHFRLRTIPNSGWPGKPRNIGVAEARGEYVQFVDQDDHLAPDALRRLHAMGRRNGSDIVIGKVASDFRGVPHGVFRTDREKCSLQTAPLHDSLTPHKLFRTDFLRENGIAYPEGRRRLEDQLYMMQAYFAAANVSVLGSYTCYFYSKRDDGNNAGSAPIVPDGYYGNLGEVLEVVQANTEPGPFRDKLLRRFYRVEILSRVSEPGVLTYDPGFLDAMCDAIRPLSLGFMGEGVHDGLGAVTRLRSALLRDDDRQGLAELAGRAATVKGAARLEDVGWLPDGRLGITLSARLTIGHDRSPFTLIRRNGRLHAHPGFTDGLLPDGELMDVTDEIGDFRCEISLRNRETAVEWLCPAHFTPVVEELGDGTCEVVLHGTGQLPSEGVGNRSRISPGFWDVWVRVRALGLVRRVRLGADRDERADAAVRPALLGSPARPVIPYFTHPHGNLTLDVARRGKRLGHALGGHPVLRMPGRSTEVRLGAFAVDGTDTCGAELLLSSGSGEGHCVPATVRPVYGRAHLVLPSAVTGVQAGPWQLGVRLDGATGPELFLGGAVVAEDGRLRVDGTVPLVDPRTIRAMRRQRRRSALRGGLRTLGGPMVRRLPPVARKKVRRVIRTLLG
ncbi:glycosyltransferase family 2 protein [Streptomyces sp. NBC_00344]|uniref:glycosyltransferase family 2 protein n=1 Tax=Streptomyces sp. NBC_00344 TaxID=2975720 RepID=UPI002E2060CE